MKTPDRFLALALTLLLSAGCSRAPVEPEVDVLEPKRGPTVPRPLTITARGTLTGRAILQGDPPDLAKLNADLRAAIERQGDRDHCLVGSPEETEQQGWKIGKDGGVGNVFVWVQPPAGRFFALTEDDLNPDKGGWKPEVVLTSPHCQLMPHALILFPSYTPADAPRERRRTDQTFVFRANSPVAHNLNLQGGGENPQSCVALPTGNDRRYELWASQVPLRASCNIHPWMSAVIRAYDHPFAALTDAEGKYTIRKVPAGVPLRVLAWHEKTGWIVEGGKEGDALQIEASTTVERSFRVRAAP